MSNFFRITVLFALAVVQGLPAPDRKPNIILIVADDMGWNDVGFHNPEMLTPHLNSLKEKGLELRRFYVGALCSPTRAGLMTGKYPDRFGLRNVVGPRAIGGLPTEEQTIAEMLATAGYKHRGAFGKWHLGHSDIKYHPLKRGFTTFYGHYNGAIDYFTHFRYGALDWHEDFEVSQDKGYSTDLISRKAVQFIRRTSSDDSPFFAYVALNAPHTPLQAQEKDLKKFGFNASQGTGDYDGGGYQMTEYKPEDYGKRGRGNSARQTYSAMVFSMDRAIGQILEAVQQEGIEENTIIWFLSDNGGDLEYAGSNLPLRGEKATEWEGGVRSVSLVYWKGKWEGGISNDEVMGFIDVMPTLSANTGGKLNASVDGVDVSQAFANRALPERFFFLGRDALVLKDWKLNKGQLFNLRTDESETNDVSAAQGEVFRQLTTALEDFKKMVKPLSLRFHPKEWRPESWSIEEAKE